MTTSNTPIYASQARPWLKFYNQKYIDQTMPACTAFELVCRQNKNRLGETALEYYGRKFTYADFIVNVKKTAAALRAAGLKKGDIATVVSVMTPEIIFAFYAADMIGATLNLVDPRYSVEGIREYIEEVDSHLLICLNVVYERCHQAAKRTHVEHVVVLSPADSLPLPLALGYKVKSVSDHSHKELSAGEVLHIFEEVFLNKTKPLSVVEAHFAQVNGITATVTLELNGQRKVVTSVGNGRLDAVANAIQSATGMEFHLETYSEHSLDEGSTSRAASYVGLVWGDNTVTWGAGTDTDIIVAGIKALVSAINNK